jgi:hypothetical protein
MDVVLEQKYYIINTVNHIHCVLYLEWSPILLKTTTTDKSVVSPWTNLQNDDNKNEWTKELDVVLEQKCEKDIIDTGNHNRNVLYLEWSPMCCC